jgi:purine nucleosidase
MTTGRAINALMDVDTGVDDAMALALAVASPQINLLGVTTVAGNVSLEQATDNTLRVLDHLGANTVPVYRGMSRPLSRDHFDAAHFHGRDGLGGAPLAASSRGTESMTAPEFIVQTARANRDNLALIFVGPLTNLAVALALEPELPRLVSRMVVMGGAFDVPGNTTPHAEFNVAVDPEAARIIAESALDVIWIGLDVTHQANLYRADWEEISTQGSPYAVLIRDVCRQSFEERHLESVHLHDPLAVGVVLQPSLVKLTTTAVSVDTSIRATAGRTRMVTDSQASQQCVATGVESSAFRKLFGDVIGVPMID